MGKPAAATAPLQTRPQPGPLSRILDSVLETGRAILNRQGGLRSKCGAGPEQLGDMCVELVNHRGEASGLALAEEILHGYEGLSADARESFYDILLREFSSDSDRLRHAARNYLADPKIETKDELRNAIESPSRRLFRRLNMVPRGISSLVRMRGELLALLPERRELREIETELRQLLVAWFNRGLLSLQRINWDSPASVLEKFIEYEAVHEINGWKDLRSRLKEDRRLFAFFHPAMPADPLIFVQIALGKGNANAIEPLIRSEQEVLDTADVDTATFYSISNCHAGLQGISFGNFLIKQVATDLRLELPSVKRLETLSPVPEFRRWINGLVAGVLDHSAPAEDLERVGALVGDADGAVSDDPLVRDALVRLCAHYLLNEKRGTYPADPVARFHLGNGALLDRIHWAADESDAGKARSFGIMVNYVYEPGELENRHEAYFAEGRIAASSTVQKLVRLQEGRRW